MPTQKKPKGPHEALYAAGYVPLPRLWAKQEDMEMILWLVKKHEDEVNYIRGKWHEEHGR